MTQTPSSSSPDSSLPAVAGVSVSPRGILLPLIRLDGGTQCRAALVQEHIEHLVEVLESGQSLPPAIVFFDGTSYWLADGFHRYHAAQHREVPELWCEVRSGTQVDAVDFALGANQTHGLRRTNADKRRAVEVALAAHPAWSLRQIAGICGVSHHFVDNVRNPAPPVTSLVEGAPPPEHPENNYGAPHEAGDPALIARTTAQTSAVESYNGPSTDEIAHRLAREDRVGKLPDLIGRARESIRAIRAIDKRLTAWLLATVLADADFASPRAIRSDAAERQGVRLPTEILDLDHDWHATLGLTLLGNVDQLAVLRVYLDARLVRADEVIRDRGSKGHAGDFLRMLLDTDLLGLEEETPAGMRKLLRLAEDELRAGAGGE
jgi:hypothetical protein